MAERIKATAEAAELKGGLYEIVRNHALRPVFADGPGGERYVNFKD